MKYLYLFLLIISFFAISCPSSDDSAELIKPDLDVKKGMSNNISLVHNLETTNFFINDQVNMTEQRPKIKKGILQLFFPSGYLV